MKKYKILVADDDRDHNHMLALVCQNAGYDVVVAVNVKAAIEMADDERPDLLILDVHLGDEVGYAIQDYLRKDETRPKIPTIFLTGDKSRWVECMTDVLGSQAVFRKPFETGELLSCIKRSLVEWEAQALASSIGRSHAAARACHRWAHSYDELP